MLILFIPIITIVNGLVLDIPINFERPIWMNNSDLFNTFFIVNPNESHGNGKSTCITFEQTAISIGNIFFEPKCGKECNIPTIVPPEYCPLSGSVSHIYVHFNDTFDESFNIVAKGCYSYKEYKKLEGVWYISNKNTIDFEYLNELPTDFLDVSDPNFLKCSVLCNAFSCFDGPGKIKLNLKFHNKEDEMKKSNNFLIVSIIGGGILVLVVIVFLIKNLKKINKINISMIQ